MEVFQPFCDAEEYDATKILIKSLALNFNKHPSLGRDRASLYYTNYSFKKDVTRRQAGPKANDAVVLLTTRADQAIKCFKTSKVNKPDLTAIFDSRRYSLPNTIKNLMAQASPFPNLLIA